MNYPKLDQQDFCRCLRCFFVKPGIPTLGLALFLTAFIPAGSSAQDIFQGLGDLPGSAFDSRAFGLSPDGDRVVGFGTSANGTEAYYWTSAGGMTPMGDFVGGGFDSTAFSVSSNNVIVGVGNTFFGDLAFRWTAGGGMTSLGDLSGGVVSSSAQGVSANGSVIVGIGTSGNGTEAFRWTQATGMVGLGDLSGGGFNSFATGISTDGTTIVGTGESNSYAEEAFRWTSLGMVGLGVLPGMSTSRGEAVSADGSVVVGRSGSSSFRWTEETGMVDLGFSQARGVSADGSIIIGRSGTIWDPQQGSRSLIDVLANDFGFDMSGWSFLEPDSISADGLTIVGAGSNTNTQNAFQREAFRVSVDARWIRNSGGDWNDRSKWAFGIDPNELHDIMITPDIGLTVTKSSGISTIRSLTLNATNGIATLDLEGGNLTVLNQTNILGNGRLTGSGTLQAIGGILNSGTIDLSGGQITGGTLTNFSVISGSGNIAARLNNTAIGEVRVGEGQQLRLTGVTSPNEGLINVVGGSFEVSRNFANQGPSALIYARDAELRFNSGLLNRASIGISFGTTDIYGDIDNTSQGRINISGGANVTFVDDLFQNGTLEVVRIGNTTSTAVMFGEFSGVGGFVGGGDVFALGDLRPGASPAAVLMDGNLYLGAGTDSYFELGGLDPGEFDQIIVTGDLGLAGDLSVDLINGFSLTFNDEFLIADVQGDLFGQFVGFSDGDLVGIFNNIELFISYSGGDGNDVVLYSSAVPEPRLAYICGLLSMVVVMGRRRQKPGCDHGIAV